MLSFAWLSPVLQEHARIWPSIAWPSGTEPLAVNDGESFWQWPHCPGLPISPLEPCSGIQAARCTARWKSGCDAAPLAGGRGGAHQWVTHQELCLKHGVLFRGNFSIHCSCTNGLQKKKRSDGLQGFLHDPSYNLPLVVRSNCSNMVSPDQNALQTKRGEGSHLS